MAELKTKLTTQDPAAFLNTVPDENKRRDSYVLLDLISQATGLEPKMWGDSIIGYGSYHYRYASGHSGDMPLVGFSPRKQNLTIYIMPGFEHYEQLMAKLGKYKLGKVCLYINKLADVDLDVLRQVVAESADYVRNYFPQAGSRS